MITGNPVRSTIAANAISRAKGMEFFGLDAGEENSVGHRR